VKSQLLGLFLLSGVAFGCSAEVIYRCSGPDGVRYQNSRCAATSAEAVIVARDTTIVRKPTPVREATDDRRLATTFQAPTVRGGQLPPGVLDDQVLNLPSWGRPARIIRSKLNRVWREQWIYSDKMTGSERCSLFFENGRLVAQEDATGDASTLQVRASLQENP